MRTRVKIAVLTVAVFVLAALPNLVVFAGFMRPHGFATGGTP